MVPINSTLLSPVTFTTLVLTLRPEFARRIMTGGGRGSGGSEHGGYGNKIGLGLSQRSMRAFHLFSKQEMEMKFALRVLLLRLIWKFLQNYFQRKKTQLSIIKRSTQIPKEGGNSKHVGGGSLSKGEEPWEDSPGTHVCLSSPAALLCQ